MPASPPRDQRLLNTSASGRSQGAGGLSGVEGENVEVRWWQHLQRHGRPSSLDGGASVNSIPA